MTVDPTLFSSPLFLMVYPTATVAQERVAADPVRELAHAIEPVHHRAARSVASGSANEAVFIAKYWSERLKCEVRYLGKNELFLNLETLHTPNAFNPRKILSETGIIGYILPFDWCDIMVQSHGS
jgi:hypothetical protein